MSPPTQEQDTARMSPPHATCPSLTQDAVMCPPPPPPSACCDASSPPSRCCDVSSQPTGCCCVFALRLRMVRCVLSPTQVAEQAVKVQKVDLHDPPQPEAEEAPHSHPPHTVQVSPILPVDDVFSLRHRMVQCVLSPTQVAEQAVMVQIVDQHTPPLPEEDDVQAVEEVAHHHPPRTVQVSPSLPAGVNVVCDRQLVTDEQGRIVISVFLLPHIIGGFSLKFYFPPFHILASLPLLLHHRTSTYLTSRPCSAFPSLPYPWLEREPPQSGRCTHTQAVCVPLPPRPCNVVECESAVSQMWRR